MNSIPRSEHPRPQFVRDNWVNLNGTWDFLFDFGNSGVARKLYLNENFSKEDIKKIIVPFCPESVLSGLGYTDWMNAVWYRRTVNISAEQLRGRILLHFGAVDYRCRVWVNEKKAGQHRGGYTPFTMDITDLVTEGENTIIVNAEDDNRNGMQVFGKQYTEYASGSCFYTRVTGIWQTVWMEFVPKNYISYAKITPMVNQQAALIEIESVGGAKVHARAFYEGKPVGEAEGIVTLGRSTLILPLSELHLWEVGQGRLYDLELTLDDEDLLKSYFGMRTVEVRKNGLYLNGKPLFMRTILDQGYYPDGIYTAPTDDALRHDIEMCMALGFNGARFHQKIFEERSFYWADKLGYIVWGESGLEGWLTPPAAKHMENMLPDWMESIRRDYSHPCIVGWCPDNEVYWTPELNADLQSMYYQITKQLDPTRPCIDASGGAHFQTDMFDIHDYEQDPEKLRKSLEPMLTDENYVHNPIHNRFCRKSVYEGQPVWISEFGGTVWNPDRPDGWGYGNTPKTEDEFATRYEGLVKVMLEHPRICGFCLTQLTDVEQEQNGMYKYDRSKKFSEETYERIRKANIAISAMEINGNK